MSLDQVSACVTASRERLAVAAAVMNSTCDEETEVGGGFGNFPPNGRRLAFNGFDFCGCEKDELASPSTRQRFLTSTS